MFPLHVCGVLAVLAALLPAEALAMDEATLSTLGSLQSNVLSYLIVVVPAALFVRYIQQHPEKSAGVCASADQGHTHTHTHAHRERERERRGRVCVGKGVEITVGPLPFLSLSLYLSHSLSPPSYIRHLYSHTDTHTQIHTRALSPLLSSAPLAAAFRSSLLLASARLHRWLQSRAPCPLSRPLRLCRGPAGPPRKSLWRALTPSVLPPSTPLRDEGDAEANDG